LPLHSSKRGTLIGFPVMVGVAQQVEHRVVIPGVAGSSPVAHPTVRRRAPTGLLGIGRGFVVFSGVLAVDSLSTSLSTRRRLVRGACLRLARALLAARSRPLAYSRRHSRLLAATRGAGPLPLRSPPCVFSRTWSATAWPWPPRPAWPPPSPNAPRAPSQPERTAAELPKQRSCENRFQLGPDLR
jgi:hypothetical protein